MFQMRLRSMISLSLQGLLGSSLVAEGVVVELSRLGCLLEGEPTTTRGYLLGGAQLIAQGPSVQGQVPLF